MNKYNSKKKNSSFVHAKRKALQRYNIFLNKEKYLNLCEKVKKEGILIQEQSKSRKVYRLDKMNIVFDCKRDIIITFLPPVKNLKIQNRSNTISLLSGDVIKI